MGVRPTVLSWVGFAVLIGLLIQWWRRYGSSEVDQRFWAVQASGARRVASAALLPIALDCVVRFGLEPLLASLAEVPDWPFVFIRLFLVAWAGWRVVSLGVGTPLAASLAGPIFLFVDLVVVKAIYILIGRGQTSTDRLLTMGGVLITFVLFASLAASVAWLGGMAARWKTRRDPLAA
jgi:hypothetical protein